jgi:hypothetical protein
MFDVIKIHVEGKNTDAALSILLIFNVVLRKAKVKRKREKNNSESVIHYDSKMPDLWLE